jgi:hypothetical protein
VNRVKASSFQRIRDHELELFTFYTAGYPTARRYAEQWASQRGWKIEERST